MTGRRSKGGTNRQDDDWDGILEALQAALSTVLTSSWTSDFCYTEVREGQERPDNTRISDTYLELLL
jgi:hypothetical protein